MIFSRPQDFILGVAVLLAGVTFIPTPKGCHEKPDLEARVRLLESRLDLTEKIQEIQSVRLCMAHEKMAEAGRSHEILFQRVQELDRRTAIVNAWEIGGALGEQRRISARLLELEKAAKSWRIEPVDCSMTVGYGSTINVSPAYHYCDTMNTSISVGADAVR